MAPEERAAGNRWLCAGMHKAALSLLDPAQKQGVLNRIKTPCQHDRGSDNPRCRLDDERLRQLQDFAGRPHRRSLGLDHVGQAVQARIVRSKTSPNAVRSFSIDVPP